MGKNYKFDENPIEFNSWVLFRGLVDIILVNDVASYIIFCFAFYNSPDNLTYIDYLRYAGGVVMCTFNIWVKSDAHRVVKDFAWYWGDFFFLIESSLVFDGVFEMAPHPMYSVGYMWFYGASLITKSYVVLFVSLAAHAAQFAFLYFVENPHIEKTYNTVASSSPENLEILQKYFRRDLIVFKNFDFFRSSDLLSVIIVAYAFVLCLLVGKIDENWKLYFYIGIFNISQVMVYISFVIAGFRVSNLPVDWTYGDTLLRLTIGSLLILLHLWTAVSVYEVIGDIGWFYGDFFIDEMRHVNVPQYTGIYRFLNNPEKLIGQAAFWGVTIICNSWALFAVTLFGQISTWLFLQYVELPHMKKIYGLNKVRKLAGVENSIQKEVKKVFKKIDNKSLKDLVKSWEYRNEKKLQRNSRMPESALNSPGETDSEDSEDDKISVSSSSLSRDSLRKRNLSNLVEAGRNVIDEVIGKLATASMETETTKNISHIPTQLYSLCFARENTLIQLGEPIEIEFIGPVKFIKSKDWIGIYEVDSNPSKDVTVKKSHGKWQFLSGKNDIYAAEEENPITSRNIGHTAITRFFNSEHQEMVRGKLTFRGFQIPWKTGKFEFRWHHDGKYGCLALSDPFEIFVKNDDFRLDEEKENLKLNGVDNYLQSIEKDLLMFIEKSLDVTGIQEHNPEWKKLGLDDNIIDVFGSRIGSVEAATYSSCKEKICKRIIYFIKEKFEVEFSWKVITLVGSCKNLAKRIDDAQKALKFD
ncbi:phosphatidylethanolamine N-methyltransferase [Clydaea vesicula]|uniref:Phosphatidylethanolamine N-methyltransferase n=1 Tax=Clydaea vesicula TaxID=447962 RepID=A0AAD5XWG6_9FUNG|nr:phosphatidylethanolamine N-methyltransferase [Clydaea vesicula]